MYILITFEGLKNNIYWHKFCYDYQKRSAQVFGWNFSKLMTIGNISLQYWLLIWVWQECTRERSCLELTDRLIFPTTSSRSSTPDPTTWCTTSINQLVLAQQTIIHHPQHIITRATCGFSNTEWSRYMFSVNAKCFWDKCASGNESMFVTSWHSQIQGVWKRDTMTYHFWSVCSYELCAYHHSVSWMYDVRVEYFTWFN